MKQTFLQSTEMKGKTRPLYVDQNRRQLKAAIISLYNA